MAYPDAIGGGTPSDIGGGNLANYMPTIWAKKALVFLENNTVCFDKFNNDYEEALSGGGDTVKINPLLEISATAVNTNADPTVYDTDQGSTTDLIINQWYEAVVGVTDFDALMGVPDYEKEILPKLTYAIAKQRDNTLNTLFGSFSQTVNAEGSKVTYEHLQEAKEYLDEANVPMENRCLFVDPGTLRDLMELDVFINADYGAGGAVSKGFVGQMPTLGAAVYMTTNLDVLNTNYHAAAMVHRDTIAVATKQDIKLDSWRSEERHTTWHRAKALWGHVIIRNTSGVWLRTRS